MRFTSFFDYPGVEPEPDDDLVFLAGWSDAQWEVLLAHTETRRFSAGDLVIRRGDYERALYILTVGTLEAVVGGGVRQRRNPIAAGSLIGEVAFFDGKARSADVRALTDGEMLRLSAEDFDSLAARRSDVARAVLFDLGRLLAARLRRSESFLTS